ncbi:Mannoside phosphorylase [Talaromyces proteolyticus]|uniref:Mannoside phosphorylase n=1 Tax=Talaromyces proteolyticus TaxID=1131652 RepID=A0AAD4PRJ0_9EURO|nr:Mannoside phosphorylase [Talaromyces proteolyticus]KAH8688982.1 Mannoside phosphorylase [Talaromyces proteolyticus]
MLSQSFLLSFLLCPLVLAVNPLLSEKAGTPPINRNSTQGDSSYRAPYFPILNWTQYENNPILGANQARGWESSYVYNPTAMVIDDMVVLIYRAQNSSLISTLGLAWSTDGYNFTRYTDPIFYPTESYENRGTEDPRLIRVNGTFYMTYTGYSDSDGVKLCMATSVDLLNWNKTGPVLPDIEHSKSGAILDEIQPDGTYHMHWGDDQLYLATSIDLIHWTMPTNNTYATSILEWEQALIESGPPPVKTRDGKWLKVYNGVASQTQGNYVKQQYSTGQMLIDPITFPYGPPVARLETPVLTPDTADEKQGQVNNVLFSEACVQFKGQWLMYFGEADTYLGVASAPVQP